MLKVKKPLPITKSVIVEKPKSVNLNEVEPEFMQKYPLLTVAYREQMIKICEYCHPKSFEVWFKPLRFIGKDGETFIISAENKGAREWIVEHYTTLLNQVFGNVKLVTYHDLKADKDA